MMSCRSALNEPTITPISLSEAPCSLSSTGRTFGSSMSIKVKTTSPASSHTNTRRRPAAV